MKLKFEEKGQALIVIALAAVVLFAFAALAIDGSRSFAEKRNSQNAADTAALAGSLAYTRGKTDTEINTIVQSRATGNGYDNNGTTNTVTIAITPVPAGECPGDADGKDITVTIVTNIDTSIAKVVGQTKLTSAVTATGRGCGYIIAPLFNGSAVVGLKPTTGNCSFDTGNSGSVTWEVSGGGIFSNGCAYSKPQNDVFTFLDAQCAISVGAISGFPDDCHQGGQVTQAISYPADVIAVQPPNPCDGTPGDIGLPQPASGSTFTNGVYCISDLDRYDQENITLNNATLYVTDAHFDLKFAGGGGLWGTATDDGGDFDGYYMVIPYNPALTPCPAFTSNNTQVIEWRGNGSGTFTGTIFAPMACLDLRGNSGSSAIHSQIIGYIVGSNGTADVSIIYNPDENHQDPYNPTVTLHK